MRGMHAQHSLRNEIRTKPYRNTQESTSPVVLQYTYSLVAGTHILIKLAFDVVGSSLSFQWQLVKESMGNMTFFIYE